MGANARMATLASFPGIADPFHLAWLEVNPVEVGKRIRAARGYSGWTRAEDLATAVGMGRTTLLKTEKGDREAKHWELVAIAELCGVPRGFFTADWDQAFADDEDANPGDLPSSARAARAVRAARDAGQRPQRSPRRSRQTPAATGSKRSA